jgi:hypothetical protein
LKRRARGDAATAGGPRRTPGAPLCGSEPAWAHKVHGPSTLSAASVTSHCLGISPD